MPTEQHADQFYIDGLIKGDTTILTKIYEKYSSAIFKFVQQNSGTIDDAKDVIQESLIVIYKKVKHTDFELTSNFFTFFYAICRNIWFKMLRKRKHKMDDVDGDLGLADNANIEEAIFMKERHRFYLSKLNELSVGCRQILQLHIEGKKIKEIVQIMGFSSVNYASKRKSKCKEQLVNRISGDADFVEFV